MQAKSVNQDLITGMFIGGGLAAIIHYINIALMTWKMRRAAADISKMVVEHALKAAKK